MTKPLDQITPDDIREWAFQQDGDRTNPVDDNEFCLYVGNSETPHCIAGQFFADHGVSDEVLADHEYVDAGEVAEHFRMSEESGEILRQLQNVADGFVDVLSPSDERNAWSTAIKKVFGERS